MIVLGHIKTPVFQYWPAIEMVVAISIAPNNSHTKKMKNKEKKIKTFHRPDQKGELSDYWIAVCDGEIEGAETEQEAIKKIINKRKDLH